MKKTVFLLSLVMSAILMPAASYVQLTATNQLQAGDTVVWVNKAALKGNAAISSNSKYIEVASVELVGKDTIVSTALQPMVLGGSTGAWTFTYLDGTKVGRVDKDTKISTSANLTYTIEIGTDSNAVICSSSATNYRIFYNTSSPRFAFYTSSTMAPVQLFKKLQAGQGPDVKVTGVALDLHSLTLRVGEAQQLKATITPEDAKNKKCTWGSLNTTIATVIDGAVTAVDKGETKVWVRTEDGDFTDTCVVTVKAGLDQPDVTWNRLQSLDSLKEGTRVFFASVKQSEDYVMGLYNYDTSKSNIRGVKATFTNDYHTVTASESYAYTVHVENGKFIFRDLDGRYLCDYNQNNLSAQTDLDNKARWNGSMNEYYEFLFTNVYNTGYVIYNNHNNDLFCCYNNFDKSNMARVAIFSDNAPEWKEPEKHPELVLLQGTDTIKGLLDWGKVVYDDSWGTEVNPYEESKSITVKTKDLEDSIYIHLVRGVEFTTYADVLPKKGGSFSIQFSVKNKGSYQDTLYVRCGERHDTIVLKAQAVDKEETKPSITFSTKTVNLCANVENEFGDIASFTFSTKNLKKNLYIKWENSSGNSIPQGTYDKVEVLAGEEYVYYGQATNMGSTDLTNEEVIVDVTAYTEGTYTSTLLFYTIDEQDKDKHAFDERVTLTIVVDYNQPTQVNEVQSSSVARKIINQNQLLIHHEDKWYMVNGQIVNK